MGNPRRQKQDMERARRQRAAAKRQRRQDKATDTTADGDQEIGDDAVPEDPRSQDEVMAALASLHARYADGGMSLEDFESDRDELMRLIRVE